MSAEVLNSWKEIAAYTGRGIRTIQRWERELGFPVRRPREKSRSAVVAIKSEIDRWFRAPHRLNNGNQHHDRFFETHTRLLRNTELLQARTSRLADCCDVLKREIDRAMEIGSRLQISFESRRPWRMDGVVSPVAKQESLSVLQHETRRAAALVTALQNSIAGGASTGEVSFQLGHSAGNVT